MRSRIIIGVGGFLLGGLGLVFLLSSTTPPPKAATLPAKASVSKTKTLPHSQPQQRRPPASVHTVKPARSTAPSGRSIRLSSREQRLGEPSAYYDLRLSFLDKFEKLIRQAKLTPEQASQTLSRIADAQMQATLAQEEINASINEPFGEAIDTVEMANILKVDFLTSMREILSREQMVRLLHIAVIADVDAFGIYFPLDITYE